MSWPKVTVLMPVHNGGKYLTIAIKSILGQTFGDFEFLIINDGSTDNSLKIIMKYATKDHRIKIISRKNKGLVASLNEGLAKAEGKYIARQDQDDISLPARLEKQVKYLNDHPWVGLVGTNYQVIDKHDRVSDVTDVFTHPADLKLLEVFFNHFGHGTIMARKDLMRKYGYSADFENAEDYELWSRLSHNTSLANLSQPLYQWRLHKGSITVSRSTEMQSQVERIREREFKFFLGHKKQFKLFAFHPFSIRGGFKSYLNKKAALYRNMALMYYRHGLNGRGAAVLLLAIAHAPWSAKTYRQLYYTLLKSRSLAKISYEPV